MVSRFAHIVLTLAVLLVVLSCAVVAGFYWATGPAIRCQVPDEVAAEAGWSSHVVSSGGLDRCYYLYTPRQYDPTLPAPLVFSFHGFLSNPASHALITGWHRLAEEYGFLVVYPQGTDFPQRWYASSIWGASPGTDDVQFYRDMLVDVKRQASVDLSRVYVNGFSNGGGMTVYLGCEAADTFAAMGTVAAAVVATEGCEPSRPMPAIVFHGTEDPIVPYEGGELGSEALQVAAMVTHAPPTFAGVEDWVAFWAQGNGCDPAAEAIPPQGDASGVRYAGCQDGAEVVFYTIDEGGHTWPGGFPIPGVGKTSRDISATEEMWRFFQTHSLED
jgi:polyhydroxybutyrate depolymerase